MSNYSYGPPPPPPPPSAAGGPSYGHPSGPYAQHSQQGHGRGSGASNSRRGGHYHGGRGDYRGAQPHYEYTGQPYPTHNPVPYGGTHPPAGSYPPHQPQWTPEHGHAPPLHAHAHAPAPLSAANYHPNYAPQPYPPSQYPQQAPYGPPQPYSHPYPSPMPPNQPQWNGQGHHQAPFANNRGRGGYSDRGGPKPPHGGAPARYETAPPPMNNGFGQPYPHDPRVAHYPPPQYPYAGPPAPPAPPRQDSHRGQHPRRGRGGHKEANVRGRGGHQNHHHGGDRSRHPKPQHQTDGNQKPESPSVGKKKKRKTNTLGLTPGVEESGNESHSEDDEGEEKVLTDKLGPEMIKVEDTAGFLAARRKNFPTKERIEAIKAIREAKKQEAIAASLEKEALRLRKQLRKVEFSIKRKRDQGDEGDEMRDSSEESSDDEPEVMSTRSQAAFPPPSPARKADVTRHCKYYSTGGTCGKKGKCRFVHDPVARVEAFREREANNGRLTIQQRLILNDKEQEDMAVLYSIQYLRTKGAMTSTGQSTEESTGATVEERDLDDKNPKSALPRSSSLLPAASPSLPPLPVKREPPQRTNPPPSIIPSADSINAQGLKHYEGWLLKPYGSTSGKQSQSDDLP